MEEKPIPVMTRIPRDLHAILKELAAQENRSLNAQIITLLQEAITQRVVQARGSDAKQPKRPPRHC